MRRHRDLELACGAAVVCALIAGLVPVTPVRAVAAVALALVLPGYAIAAAAFARSRLSGPQGWVVAAGVSLAVLPLSALLLNVIPSGLTTASWAILLVLVVLLACRWAAITRPAWVQTERRTFLLRPRDAVLLALAAVMVAGAVVLAETPLPAKNASGYTALWIVPSGPQQGAVEVGVLSDQQQDTSYRLVVSNSGEAPTTERMRLAPGAQRTFVIPIGRAPGQRTHVVAALFRAGRPVTVYRQVDIWLPRRGSFP